ncbi:MAG: ribosome recycling factor [Bacillales bacterium]|nr:ribosome recycling factor [Bacillales bacterium]
MGKQVLASTKERMDKAIGSYTRDLASIRAGRASASLLDRVMIDYYGSPTPVNQMAGVSIPEPRMIVIQPYDRGTLRDIEKAIQISDLGINPTNDGTVIRLVIPALTEERRKELAKKVKSAAEDAKIAIRNIRRDANEDLKKLEKAAEISEDGLKGFSNDVQKMTDEHIAKVDQIAKDKEKQIMEV